jgi:hypothetical protein
MDTISLHVLARVLLNPTTSGTFHLHICLSSASHLVYILDLEDLRKVNLGNSKNASVQLFVLREKSDLKIYLIFFMYLIRNDHLK